MTAGQSSHDLSRSRDKLHGLLVVAAAFLASLAISLWAKHVSEPEQGRPPAPATTVGIVGWPKAVDVVATLPAARGLTRRTQLRGFVADGVHSNGTIDMSAAAWIRYAFQSAPGQGPQPPRVPGVVPRRNLCGRQDVFVRNNGMAAMEDQLSVVCPPVAIDPLPEPRCTLKQVWDYAAAKGAPRSALARIEYYRATAGPAWRFELSDGSFRFSIYGDCRRELSSREAVGKVP